MLREEGDENAVAHVALKKLIESDSRMCMPDQTIPDPCSVSILKVSCTENFELVPCNAIAVSQRYFSSSC